MSKLYDYFGLVGIASVVAWLGALGMLACYARSPRRTRRYLLACIQLFRA